MPLPDPPREGLCPASHGYAYNHGERCCKTFKDSTGQALTINSVSCENNEMEECRVEFCFSNPRGFSILFYLDFTHALILIYNCGYSIGRHVKFNLCI